MEYALWSMTMDYGLRIVWILTKDNMDYGMTMDRVVMSCGIIWSFWTRA